MWRSEPNTFARTRPAQLDTQYRTHVAPTPSALSDDDANKWFHVPGSSSSSSGINNLSRSRRDGFGASDGLVYSALHASSAATTASGPSPRVTARHSAREHDAAYTDSEAAASDVSRLLRQYRDENTRLREQLHAKALHETHLLSKVEELSRQYALLQLECQRMSGSQTVARLFAKEGEATSADTARVRLSEQTEELQQLRLSVVELEGRVEAYKEALHRARAHHVDAATDKTHDADGHASLHTLLIESLHTADYLVKVFNAVQHCQSSRHDSDGGCPRSQHECTRRCLSAAVKGAVRPPELHDVTAGPENNTGAANTEAAVAVREELQYCETVAVRLAATLLAQQPVEREGGRTAVGGRDAAAASDASYPGAERDDDASVPHCHDSALIEDAAAAEAPDTAPQTGDVPADYGAIAARAPRSKQPRCRPDVEDCEVQ